MKKILSKILIIVLLIGLSISLPNQLVTRAINADEVNLETSNKEANASERDEKIFSDATLEDDFDESSILVGGSAELTFLNIYNGWL